MKIFRSLRWISPSRPSVALFSVLIFILIGGYIKSYAFVDDVPGIEPPPFYDLLKPLSIWSAMMLLILPWSMIGLAVCSTGICGILMGLSMIPIFSALSYLEASWFVHVWKGLGRRGKLLAISSILPEIPSFPAILIDPIFFTSSIILSSLVIAVHLISTYGLLEVLYKLIRRR